MAPVIAPGDTDVSYWRMPRTRAASRQALNACRLAWISANTDAFFSSAPMIAPMPANVLMDIKQQEACDRQ